MLRAQVFPHPGWDGAMYRQKLFELSSAKVDGKRSTYPFDVLLAVVSEYISLSLIILTRPQCCAPRTEWMSRPAAGGSISDRTPT